MLDIVWRLAQGCVVSAEIAQTAGSAGTPDPMTAEEVAEMLRVSPAYVRRLVRKGQLPCLDLPGVIRVRRSDVQHLLDRNAA